VAHIVKQWVEKGTLNPVLPSRLIDPSKTAMPLRETIRGPRVLDIMDRKVIAIGQDEEIRAAAQNLLKGETNHLPVIGTSGKLVGIVTTYDISKAVVNPGKASTVRDIMKKKVITTTPDEAVDIAVRKLEKHNISALPVIDKEERVIGMLTAMNLGKLFGGRWLK
jgi:CBS domain-containing protein